VTEPLVLTADHGAVRVLTLNRPEARNALSRDLIRATYSALTEADADDSVWAVVLTGADPAFCAGVDLKEAQRDGLKYFEEFRSQSCIVAVAKMRTPIIGAINGACFTGGLERWRSAATSSWPRSGRCSPKRAPASASCLAAA
jgi:enoyl-CoA hydratase/carnithine racemase